MILKRIIISFFVVTAHLVADGQLTISPSNANACACSGGITYQSAIISNVDYVLLDATGAIITSGSSANGTFALNGLCPEVYTLDVTQGVTNSTEAFNIPTQTLNPGDAAQLGVCSTEVNQSLNSNISGIVGGGTWTDPLGQSIVMPVPAANFVDGWYQYTVPSGACSVTTGVFVDAIQNAFPGLTTTYLICDDYPAFEMLQYLNGNAEPNGEWFNFDTGASVSSIFDPATMNSQSFLYMIDTVPGCDPVFSVLTVDENQLPDAGENAAITVCQNAATFNMINYLGGNPNGGGLWYAPDNTPVSGNFNPATYVAGTYRYHQNGIVPCVDDDAFLNITFISDNPSGEPATITICENGNSVNMLNALNGNPLAGGSWTNSAGATVDGSFNPATENPGIYYYNYPNVVCIPQNVGLTIQVETLPNAGNNNAVSVCENTATINLNGLLSAGADVGGVWTDSNNQLVSPNFSPPASGNSFQFNYEVNGNICPDDNASFTISLEPLSTTPPDVALGMCAEDASIDLHTLYPQFPTIQFENLNGTVAASIFDPSGSNGANIVAILPSTNSCPDGEGEITIAVTQPLFLEDSVTATLCNSLTNFNLASLDPLATIANGNWFNSSNEIISPNIILDFTGSNTYHFISTLNTTCGGNELTAIVEVFNTTDAGPNNNVEFCFDHVPELLVDLMPQTAGGNGTWTFNGLPYSLPIVDPAGGVSGSYVYFIPANGPCPADAAELFVTIQNGINYDAGENIEVCAGSPVQQIGQSPSPNTTYLWSPATNLSNINSAFPSVTIPDNVGADITTNYHVEISDGVCTSEDDVLVTVFALPSFTIGDLYEICIGESISLGVNTPGDYLWSPSFLFDDYTAQNTNLSTLQDVSVSLLVTNSNGCTSTDDADIIVHPKPTIVFTPESMASCSPLHIKYFLDNQSSNIDHVIWEIPGVQFFNEDTLETDLYETGIYDVNLTAYSDFGCTSSEQYNQVLEVYEIPDAAFYSDPEELTTIDPIATFFSESINAVLYEWDFSGLGTSTEEQPIFEFPNGEPINFDICLKVTSEHGCIDSTCNILHLDNEYIFFAPNALTPDGDGINDVFLPVMRGFEENTYSLEIFDRWGDRIFVTTEYGKPWTGNVHDGGYYVQDDVYIWQVKVKDKENAEYRVFRGSLTVVR